MAVTKDIIITTLVESTRRDEEVAAELRVLTDAVRASVAVGEDHTAIARERIRIEKAKQKNRMTWVKMFLSTQAGNGAILLVVYGIAKLLGIDIGVTP